MIFILGLVMVTGLGFIYKSARAITELSERRAQFVSSVTHELKTPLTNIRMYIEMLEQGIARTPEREQDYFRILNSEIGRLSRLIHNILEFSKLEKKQLHLHLCQGTFEEVIAEVVALMSEKLLQEGFVLKTNAENARPFVYDREVMLQVLINLIENSMKFGKNAEQKDLSLKIRHEPKQVLISVSDTGPGIPRHALKRVFEDFYRADHPLIRNTQGTGIGLAFVRKVVRAMGGKVWAENNPGPGCTITISLPISFSTSDH
jgi:signal transduction histidine kinase